MSNNHNANIQFTEEEMKRFFNQPYQIKNGNRQQSIEVDPGGYVADYVNATGGNR